MRALFCGGAGFRTMSDPSSRLAVVGPEGAQHGEGQQRPGDARLLPLSLATNAQNT